MVQLHWTRTARLGLSYIVHVQYNRKTHCDRTSLKLALNLGLNFSRIFQTLLRCSIKDTRNFKTVFKPSELWKKYCLALRLLQRSIFTRKKIIFLFLRDRNYFFDKKFNVMKMEANVSSARTAQNTAHLDFQLNPRDLVLISQLLYQVIE